MKFVLAKNRLVAVVLIALLGLDGVQSVTKDPSFIVWGDTDHGEYCITTNDALTAVTLQPCDFEVADPKQLFLVDDENMFMSVLDDLKCLEFMNFNNVDSLDEAPVIITDCYALSGGIAESYLYMNFHAINNDGTLVQLQDSYADLNYCVAPLNDVPCNTNHKGAISMLPCQPNQRFSWRFVVANCADLNVYEFGEMGPRVGRVCLDEDSRLCMEANVNDGTVHLVDPGDVTFNKEGTWVWDGNFDDGICFSTGLLVVGTHEGGKHCLQQGHNHADTIHDGTILIVAPCDCNNVLQQFGCEWFGNNGGRRLQPKSNIDLCVDHHGSHANENDNIVLKNCDPDYASLYWSGNLATKRIWPLMRSGDIISSDDEINHLGDADANLEQELDGTFRVLVDATFFWESVPRYAVTEGSEVVTTKLQGDGNLITRDEFNEVLWKSEWFGGVTGGTDIGYYLAYSVELPTWDLIDIGIYPGSPIETSGVAFHNEFVDSEPLEMLWKDDSVGI